MRSSAFLYTAGVLASVAAAVFLSACGGGGCNPCEPDQPSPPVNCATRPELCK